MIALGINIRQQVESDGFAVVPDVLSAATLDSLVAAVDRVLKRRDGRTDYAMRNLARSVPEVGQIAESSAVQNLLQPFFESAPFLTRSIFFDKTPSANWKVAWHQDVTIAVSEKINLPGFTAWSVKDGVVHVQPPSALLARMLTLRLHLDDCGPANGPLEVIPGSHQAGRLSAEQIAEWRQRQSPVPCVVKRGGALLMRPLLLHASSPATEPKHRRVVHLEFAADPLPGGLQWLGSAET